MILSALFLITSVGLLVRASKLRSLDAYSILYQLGAGLLISLSVLAFIEYEISRAPVELPAPYAWSKAHSLVSLWVLVLGVVNVFVFANFHWRWSRPLKLIFGLLLVLPATILSGMLAFTDFHVISDMVATGSYWQYVIKTDQFWIWAWVCWQAFWVIALLVFLGYSFAKPLSRKDLIGRVVFLALLIVLVLISLTYYVILPSQTDWMGNYFLSLPASASALILSWVYTNFQTQQISSLRASQSVIQGMTNILLLTDENFVIKEVNPATSKAFQVGKNLMVGLPIQKVLEELAKDDWERVAERIQSLGPGEEIVRETQVRFRQRMVSLVLTISPVFRQNKRKIGYVFLGTDLTQFKQVESMLIEYTQQLERTNEELERFAYIASHDLKTPIRNISSFLSLIQRRLPIEQDPELGEFLDFAIDNSKRAFTLIQDVLEYSRTAASELNIEEVALNKLLEEIKRDFGVHLRQQSALLKWDDLPQVLGDRAQLKQLMQNLIENGLKYNDAEYPYVEVKAFGEAGYHVLLIKDNGIGIKAEYQKQILGMFTRLHTLEEYPGTGIGLAICEKIVKAHGGQISVESEEGEGTTFLIRLPLEPKRSYIHSGSTQSLPLSKNEPIA